MALVTLTSMVVDLASSLVLRLAAVETPSDDSMPGLGSFLAFTFLAVALYFLLKNMNARLRRMSYREKERQEAEAERRAEAEAEAQSERDAALRRDAGEVAGDATPGGDDPSRS